MANVPSAALRQGVATSLVERRLQLIERCSDLEVQLGRAGEVVAELRRLVDEYPLREALWDSLMRALYAAGRQVEALAAYHELAETLADQLGVDPAESLRRTHQGILDRTLTTPGQLVAPVAEPRAPYQAPR